MCQGVIHPNFEAGSADNPSITEAKFNPTLLKLYAMVLEGKLAGLNRGDSGQLGKVVSGEGPAQLIAFSSCKDCCFVDFLKAFDCSPGNIRGRS